MLRCHFLQGRYIIDGLEYLASLYASANAKYFIILVNIISAKIINLISVFHLEDSKLSG